VGSRRPRRFVGALVVLGASLVTLGIAIGRQVLAVRAADRCADVLLDAESLPKELGYDTVYEELDAMGNTPAAWRRLAERLDGRPGCLCVSERRAVIAFALPYYFVARRLADESVVAGYKPTGFESVPDMRLEREGIITVTNAAGERTEEPLDSVLELW